MTDRLPFDPDKMAAARGRPATPVSNAPMTVSQLAGRIGESLAAGFPVSVRVIGEVSGFRDRTHWYFDLKDAGAVASCVMFASAARKLRFTPANGQEVVITGRPDFYAKAGKVSVIVERLEPVGAGALELAYRALCAELKALGWFEQGRKRPIPAWPRRVAIVTSRTGAALQDVLDTMRRRFPAMPVSLVDVRVQGDGAARDVADAIHWLGRERAKIGVDVILITRGGGSMEDLWAFNERIVAEAVVQSPIPVVAAIGHETDTTIAELVADLRCSTPTQAAMRLTPDREALSEQLDSLGLRLLGAVRRETDRSASLASLARHLRLAAHGSVRSSAHQLERLSGRLEAHRPAALQARRAAVLEGARSRLGAAIRRRLASVRLDELASGLSRAWAAAAQRKGTQLAALERQLSAVGPMSVLRRGFSYTSLEDGRLLKTPGDVVAGDRLRTRLADGEVRSVVEGAPPLEAGRRVRAKQARPQSPDTGEGPAQMDLFKSER